MKLDKAKFKQDIVNYLKVKFIKTPEEATPREVYEAVSNAVMEYIAENWIATKKAYDKKVKEAYYLSAEFLMGRALGNNLVNLLIDKDVKDVLQELKFDYNQIEDEEMDAGLGNGGLGRLAACFLDSLATLELPGHGYGIRYKYGIFEQKIVDGKQYEVPEMWLKYGDPWSVKKIDEAVEVKFGGYVSSYVNEKGRLCFSIENAEVVKAIPYDTPIVGYGVKNVNTLRLWEAVSPEEFNFQLFNDGMYLKSVERENTAEDISRVLYPNDNTYAGKVLRLKQQYFFVSASIQDIVRKYKRQWGNDFSKFPSKVAIQLNDTHPVVAIPELMRILLDEEYLDWDTAWDIVTKTFAYTNHTILAEALEKWPVDMFAGLLPRIYQLVEEINRRFMDGIHSKYPGDWDRFHRMSIIADNRVKMAWLAIVGSHSVNGVAELHTNILKNTELKDWYEYYPKKFNNKTNGVTQRRFLLKANPELASLITEKIGDKWITKLDELKKLEQFLDDKTFVKRFMEIKKNNKKVLAELIKERNNVVVDVNSIFDVQVKRLHEYKRQLLNVLHIIYLYNKLKENPKLDIYPRTFIFGAKAAPGYYRAKLIIHLINAVADKINNDPAINGKIKVVFLSNYNVSLAEKIFPASDVSEQISTAGYEASGTGNMKFMMNGAITIGTLDGANVEIAEEVGDKNIFIFGHKANEIAEMTARGGYNPWDVLNANPELNKALNTLVDGTFDGGQNFFRNLYDSLVYGVDGNRPDVYYVLKDFDSYVLAQEKIDKAYRKPEEWAKKAIINVANSGKFSSDRTIMEYAKDIWNIKPVTVK